MTGDSWTAEVREAKEWLAEKQRAMKECGCAVCHASLLLAERLLADVQHRAAAEAP